MPRLTRLKSSSGIYHVVIRGSGRQNLFYEKYDYRACQRILFKAKERFEFVLYAYCMMNNHVHLLLKSPLADLPVVMQRICSMYAMYFNRRYDRKGHLFQGRFHSEIVEDEEYFLTAMAYIHGNPCRAGIVETMEQYAFSSYREYTKDVPGMTDTQAVLSYMTREELIRFHERETQRKVADLNNIESRTEEEALELLCRIIKSNNPLSFSNLNHISQHSCIVQMKNEMVTYAQIARITGMPYERIRYLGKMR